MPEDIREFMPKTLLEQVRETWPGWLSCCVDEMLYSHDITPPGEYDHGKLHTPLKVHCPAKRFGDGEDVHYVDAKRVLVAVRDFLEALAIGECAGNGKTFITEGRKKSVKYVDKPVVKASKPADIKPAAVQPPAASTVYGSLKV